MFMLIMMGDQPALYITQAVINFAWDLDRVPCRERTNLDRCLSIMVIEFELAPQ